MKCKYCLLESTYSPIEGFGLHGIDIYFCHNCFVECLYVKHSGDKISTSIYCKIEDKMYRWTIINKNMAHLWEVKVPGEPGLKINKDLVLIKTFKNNIPEITPDNILNKITSWLPFI